jgi:hypothetical protein
MCTRNIRAGPLLQSAAGLSGVEMASVEGRPCGRVACSDHGLNLRGGAGCPDTQSGGDAEDCKATTHTVGLAD